MRIEVLYVPGCPNYEPAVARIQQVLASESLQAEVHGVAVSSEAEAKVLLFPGSPTIRIDRDDVEPNQTHNLGLSCRLYTNRSGAHQRKCFDWLFQERSAKHEHSRSHDMHKKVTLYSQPG